jgi:hypothetical protein
MAISATGASAATTKWTTTPAMPLVSGAPEGKANSVDCLLDKSCIAVGSNGEPALTIPYAARWKAGSWSNQNVQNSGFPADFGGQGALNSVSCTYTQCIAVGTYKTPGATEKPFAYRWNGTTWTLQNLAVLGSPYESSLNGIRCEGGEAISSCVAVGDYQLSGGAKKPWVAKYNGLTNTWSMEDLGGLTTVSTSLRSVTCAGASTCMAVGYTNPTGSSAGVALQWSGGKWSAAKVAVPAASKWRLEGIARKQGGNFFEAVGYSVNLNTGIKVPLAEYWNGTEWAIQSTSSPAGATGAGLSGVDCLSSCWSTGSFTTSTSTGTPLAERLEASTWTVDLPNSIAGGTSQNLPGISCYEVNKCIAVGYYTSSGKVLPMAQTVVRE